MNFKEAIDTIEMILMCKDVPLIVGDSGIGKTSLVRELSDRTNSKLVTIDANLLKEGEIGGLPTVNNKLQTVYATHSKLVEVQNIVENNPNQEVILFIDELNRCDHAVQQELMNLILNREINGYHLSNRVNVIAAMNPSNRYEAYSDSEYEVVDMDPAQEDRFVWVQMESDVKEWIKWGMSQKGNINEAIIEFISTSPEFLHNPSSSDEIKPTPRSWERVSKAYDVYEANKEKYSINTLYNVIKGNVGESIAQDFISYIKNSKNPLLRPKSIFSYEILPYDVKEIIAKESHSRLYILAKSCMAYLDELKNRNNELLVFCQLIKEYPRDLRLGVMKEIKSEVSKELYDELLNEDAFIDAFFDIYS